MPHKPWSEERKRLASERAKASWANKTVGKSSETPGISTPMSTTEEPLQPMWSAHHTHQWLAGEYVRTDRGSRLHTIYCATGGEWKELD